MGSSSSMGLLLNGLSVYSFFFKKFYVHIFGEGPAGATAHVWRAEDNLWVSFLHSAT